MYFVIIALILQVVYIALGIYITHLQNNGRKGDQSEEDFNKYIMHWKSINFSVQVAACICLLLYLFLLRMQGVI